MPDKTIDEYPRGKADNSVVRASTSTFKGARYFSFRAWYQNPEREGDFLPTKNGLNLPVEEYLEFRTLVAEMDKELNFDPATLENDTDA